MYAELFPEDPRAAKALVAIVLDDLLKSDDSDREVLLAQFCSAAWPTQRAQNQ